MKDDLEDSLGLIAEMQRNSLRRAVAPRWFSFAMAGLAGLLFTIVVEFGRLGLAVLPVMLLVVAIRYFKAGVRPYFFRPSRDVLNEIRDELGTKSVVSIFVVCGMISSPFLLLEVMELRAGGNLWVSYAGGVAIAVFAFISAESSRRFYVKRYGG